MHEINLRNPPNEQKNSRIFDVMKMKGAMMKRILVISILPGLILAAAVIWRFGACRTAEFASFAEHFSEASYFALAGIGGHRVLLVSQETFGNDEMQDRQAVEASIFALDDKGKIVSLGSIRSQGTLYPVSMLDDRIMVGGHQFVRIYSIRGGDVPELVLESGGEGDGPELDAWFRMFEKGTPVKFGRRLPK